VPVFGYEFNDPNAPPTVGFGTVVEPPNDAFGFPSASEHAWELQFLFNFGTTLSADEQQLAGEMKTYWGNFVNTGNPNLPRNTPSGCHSTSSELSKTLCPGRGFRTLSLTLDRNTSAGFGSRSSLPRRRSSPGLSGCII
jgi:Carboxylesterase family